MIIYESVTFIYSLHCRDICYCPHAIYITPPRKLAVFPRWQMICFNCSDLHRLADKFCLHYNIFVYIRHIWIKPVLCSRMVSLFHHTCPWTHRCLQSSPSAHRNGRVFIHSVQTACCYWILNRREKIAPIVKFTDECEPLMVISVLMWVQ